VGPSAKTASVILIVENETVIRWGTVKMAEEAGFVMESNDGLILIDFARCR
jgi:hypothetical protein